MEDTEEYNSNIELFKPVFIYLPYKMIFFFTSLYYAILLKILLEKMFFTLTLIISQITDQRVSACQYKKKCFIFIYLLICLELKFL